MRLGESMPGQAQLLGLLFDYFFRRQFRLYFAKIYKALFILPGRLEHTVIQFLEFVVCLIGYSDLLRTFGAPCVDFSVLNKAGQVFRMVDQRVLHVGIGLRHPCLLLGADAA